MERNVESIDGETCLFYTVILILAFKTLFCELRCPSSWNEQKFIEIIKVEIK